MDTSIEEIAKALEDVGNQLGEVANGDAVVGSPIKLGALTVYPVSRISVGLGAGGGEGEEASPSEKGSGQSEPSSSAMKIKVGLTMGDSGEGGGAGGGAKARPMALLVFSQEGVNVLPIPDKKGKLDVLFEKIPELVERFKPKGCA